MYKDDLWQERLNTGKTQGCLLKIFIALEAILYLMSTAIRAQLFILFKKAVHSILPNLIKNQHPHSTYFPLTGYVARLGINWMLSHADVLQTYKTLPQFTEPSEGAFVTVFVLNPVLCLPPRAMK